MNDVAPFERFVDRLRGIGQEEMADALEACAENQDRWAAIGAHHVEVPHYDDLESTMIITAFEAGRLYERGLDADGSDQSSQDDEDSDPGRNGR